MANGIEYLVFDVDNTVTEDLKPLSDSMSDILERTGKILGFISGTDVSELQRMISSKLTSKHHLLGNTGTHYITVENGLEKEMLKDFLSEDEKAEILEAVSILKIRYGLIPLTSDSDQIQDRGSQITMSILGRHAPPESKNSYDHDKTKRKVFAAYLKGILGEEKYDINMGGTTSLDITRKGRDKYWAMMTFMNLNGLIPPQIAFFGDQLKEGGNDYPVIKTGVECVEVRSSLDTLEILREFYVDI